MGLNCLNENPRKRVSYFSMKRLNSINDLMQKSFQAEIPSNFQLERILAYFCSPSQKSSWKQRYINPRIRLEL